MGCVLVGGGGDDSPGAESGDERPGASAPGQAPDTANGDGDTGEDDADRGEPGGGEQDPAAGAEPANGQPLWQAPAGSDYWLDRFGGYMRPEERALFRATPESRRFERFGEALLGYERREALLEPYVDQLGPDEIAAYRRLPDMTATRAWLRERFGGE
jgi:hypothetical protein